MSNETGELTETRGEVRVEWRIEIPSKEAWYTSPVFPLSDSCWCLEISFYNKTSVDIYLQRQDCGPPKTLSFTIGFKKADDTEEVITRKESFIFVKDCENKRLVVKNVGSIQYSHGIMVVICNLNSKEQHFVSVSLFRRLWNVSLTLNKILKKRKNTDVMVKVLDEELTAHRLILDTRCPDFLSKIQCEMKEEQSRGTDAEKNCNEGTLSNVLSYMYSGSLDELSQQNVRSVYEFAHKYQLMELKKLCTVFMERNLTRNDVCDVITFADVFNDTKLRESAKEFLARNSSEIVDTCNWKEFKKENSHLCVEILEHMMKKEAV